jgi:hypothetical protein
LLNLWNESKPDRRAAKQQRVRKQQVQIFVHGVKLVALPLAVNIFVWLEMRLPLFAVLA